MTNDQETHKVGAPHVPERRRRTAEDVVAELEERLMAAIQDGDAAVEGRLMTRMQTLETNFGDVIVESRNAILAHLQKQDEQATKIEAKVDAHEIVLRTKQAEDDEQARAKAERDHDEKLIADHEALRLQKEVDDRAARLRTLNKFIVPLYGATTATFISALVEFFNAANAGLRWNNQAFLVTGLLLLGSFLSLLLWKFG